MPRRVSTILAVAVALFMVFAVGEVAVAAPEGIVIDGVMDEGEWEEYWWFDDDDEPKMTGYLAFDAENMYIAVVVENDGIAGSRDIFYIYIDVPPVGEFNEGRDALSPGVRHCGTPVYREHPSEGGLPTVWDPEDDGYPEGLDMAVTGLGGEERVYELKVPLDLIPASYGDTIGLKVFARNTGDGGPGTDYLNYYPDIPEGTPSVRPPTWVTVEGNYEHVTIPYPPVHNKTKGTYHDTIQDAIDAAEDGDTIEVAAGTYVEQLLIEGADKDNITLVGAVDEDGVPTSIIDLSGFTSGHGVRIIDAAGVTFKNFEVHDSPGRGVYATRTDDITIDNVVSHSNSVDGIRVRESVDATIQNCVSSNNSGDGITFYSYGWVLNNVVGDNAERGIYIQGDVAQDTTGVTGEVTASGNEVFGNLNGPPIGASDARVGGIIVYASRHAPAITRVEIENNIIYDNNGPGLLLYKVNNEYDSASGIASVVDPDAESIVRGNQIYGNNDLSRTWGISPGDGILAYHSHNVVIEGNEICESVVGIRISNTYRYNLFGPSTNHTVRDNIIYDNEYSVYVQGGVNHAVENTVVEFNCFYDNDNGLVNLDNFDEIVGATENWWGDETGPSDEGPGEGDAVSVNVEFDPWYADQDRTELASNRPVMNTTQATSHDTIQEAIDEAGPGDTIEVAAGYYEEDDATWRDLRIDKSLNLIGAGSGQTVVGLSEGKMNGVEIRGSDLAVTIEGITFTKREGAGYASNYGLRIAETTSTFDSLVLRDVEILHAKDVGIHMGSAGTFAEVLIENCAFEDNKYALYEQGTVTDMTIKNSIFKYNRYMTVILDGSYGDLTLEGVTITDSGHYSLSIGGDADTVLIQACDIIDGGGYRLYVGHKDLTPDIGQLTVKDSTLIGSTDECVVDFERGTIGKLVFRNVEVADAAQSNIRVKAPTIIGEVHFIDCDIHGAGTGDHHSGVWFMGKADKVVITDSHFYGNAYRGFDFASLASGTSGDGVKNVTVTGSTFNDNADCGISMFNIKDVSLTDVTASNNDKAGLLVWEWHSSTTGLTIRESTIADNNWAGLWFVEDGGSIEDVVITNSNVVGNGEWGILNETGEVVDARFNYWGHASGPFDEVRGRGQGDAVSENVDYTPWYTRSDLTLPSNALQVVVDAMPVGTGTVTGGGTFSFFEAITVRAEPEEGYRFVNWTEDGTEVSTLANFSFVVRGERQLTANFAEVIPDTYILEVVVIGEGAVEVDPDLDQYEEGTEVTLTAIADEGWEFVEWTGDVTGTDPEITVTMDEDLEVTAVFARLQYTLDVTIEGEGTVEVDPDEDFYHHGDEVTLTAIPDEGWHFIRWQDETGASVGSEAVLTVIMTEDTELTAVFAEVPPEEFTLTMELPEGEGTVTPAVGEHDYTEGTVVSLTAVPDEGWQFSHWIGDVADPDLAETTITVEADETVQAVFTRIQYTLTVLQPEGEGEVSPEPGEYTHSHGDVVQLSAIADAGWEFDGWVGEVADPDSAETTITMLADETVGAVFTLEEYTLTVSTEGEGSVDIDPDEDFYHYGDRVELTAIPDEGWEFSYWTRNVEDRYDPETAITMYQNERVLAHFAEMFDEITDDDEDDRDIFVPRDRRHGALNLRGLLGAGTQSASVMQQQVTVTLPVGVTITADTDIGLVTVRFPRGTQISAPAEWPGYLNLPTAVDREPGDVGLDDIITADLSVVEIGFGDLELSLDPAVRIAFEGHSGKLVGYSREGVFTAITEVAAEDSQEWADANLGPGEAAVFDDGEDLIIWTTHMTEFATYDRLYTLDVEVIGEGTVEIDPDLEAYEEGTEVTLTAIADDGWEFVEWTGDVTDTASEITVTMDADKSITAVFEEVPTYTLTVDVIGEGTVEIEPDLEEYEEGTEVTLTAIPADGWEFVEWTGDVTGTDAELSVTMDADKSVTAVFEEEVVVVPDTYTLTVDVVGEGTVEIEPDLEEYEEGTEVTLTAIPEDGWEFVEWTGDVKGTESEITVVMDEDKSVTAVFEEEVAPPVPPVVTPRHDVTIEVDGEGSVVPAVGVHRYREGAKITIIATPAEGMVFDEWLIDGELSGVKVPTLSITVEDDVTVTAVFVEVEPPVILPYVGEIIDPAQGGVLAVEGVVTLDVPAGATENPAEFGVTVRDAGEEEVAEALGVRVAVGDLVYDFAVTDIADPDQRVRKFAEPLTLTFPYDPEEVDDPASLLVHRYDEDQGNWIPMPSRVDEEAQTIIVTTYRLSYVAIFEVVEQLTDIAGHWAEEYILEMSAVGAVTGYPDLTFQPDELVNREQFAKMLVEVADVEVPAVARRLPFLIEDADAVSDWAQPYVEAAIIEGLITGYDDGTFRPDALVTRAQVATMISRALDLTPEGELTFADADEIPDWAADHVALLAELGIIEGLPGNLFGPDQETTRAQAATFLSRYLDVRLGR